MVGHGRGLEDEVDSVRRVELADEKVEPRKIRDGDGDGNGDWGRGTEHRVPPNIGPSDRLQARYLRSRPACQDATQLCSPCSKFTSGELWNKA